MTTFLDVDDRTSSVLDAAIEISHSLFALLEEAQKMSREKAEEVKKMSTYASEKDLSYVLFDVRGNIKKTLLHTCIEELGPATRIPHFSPSDLHKTLLFLFHANEKKEFFAKTLAEKKKTDHKKLYEAKENVRTVYHNTEQTAAKKKIKEDLVSYFHSLLVNFEADKEKNKVTSEDIQNSARDILKDIVRDATLVSRKLSSAVTLTPTTTPTQYKPPQSAPR